MRFVIDTERINDFKEAKYIIDQLMLYFQDYANAYAIPLVDDEDFRDFCANSDIPYKVIYTRPEYRQTYCTSCPKFDIDNNYCDDVCNEYINCDVIDDTDEDDFMEDNEYED